MNKRLVVAATVMVLFLAGCTDKRGYGSGEITDFKDKDNQPLGTSTTPPPEIAAPPVTEPSANPTTTRPPAPTTTAKPPVQGYPIKIQSDQSNTHFEPRIAQVRAGTPITWTNTDSVPRSIELADQSFVSGPIPPGGTATFTPRRAGDLNYSDGTRPYAVGTIQVR